MNGLWWLLLLCCCGNKNNCGNNRCHSSCTSHSHNVGNSSCIQPRMSEKCDLDEREAAWTPYVGKNKQDDCGCEHSH